MDSVVHSFVSVMPESSQVDIFLRFIKKRHLFVGGLWLCATAGALAITLGPNTRTALIGKPLDISVQVMLDAGEDLAALCLDADVFYVDRHLDKSRIQVVAEMSVNAPESRIRIRATSPVEGPVVTVHLRAGCVQKTARRYVVLAMAQPQLTALNVDNASQTPLSAGPLAAPSDSLLNAGKVQALETELRQLREELVKNKAVLAEEKIQFEKAQSGGYRKELVYGLLAMLAVILGALLFLLRRRPSIPAAQEGGTLWWRRSERADASPASEQLAGKPVRPASRMDMDLDSDESLLDGLKRRPPRAPPEWIPPLPARDRARFSISVPFVHRTVKVPELFDLQQQVEFFSSLGQQEKAIALLRKHLVNNLKTSALVYLNLLDLYHQTDNQEDFADLRADFNHVFHTQIAPFDRYTAGESDAPNYEAALARIQAVWPTRRVFDVIDDALFREPGNAAEVLDLESYRDLLLLYAVAREINEFQSSGAGNFGDSAWTDLAMPKSSPRLGLDIDLSLFAGGSDSPGKTADVPASARSGRTRDLRSDAAAAPTGSSLSVQQNPVEPTVFDSLVDFDDYDTGLRPDGLR